MDQLSMLDVVKLYQETQENAFTAICKEWEDVNKRLITADFNNSVKPILDGKMQMRIWYTFIEPEYVQSTVEALSEQGYRNIQVMTHKKATNAEETNEPN